jgi:hypothetical protein
MLFILFVSIQMLHADTNLVCSATAIATPTLICTGQGATLSATLGGPGSGSATYV